MLSLMEAQAHFFELNHESVSELDSYRRKLSEEVIACLSLSDIISYAINLLPVI